jgi:predicted nucleic acid-binding protein
MKIVVDSNRVIAALLKDSTTRQILHNDSFEFVSPEFVMEEVAKYKAELMVKAKITEEQFETLLSMLIAEITVIEKIKYAADIRVLEKEIPDKKDIPYLACCVATRAEGVWTHDPHFLKQNKIRVFTNIDLIKIKESPLKRYLYDESDSISIDKAAAQIKKKQKSN